MSDLWRLVLLSPIAGWTLLVVLYGGGGPDLVRAVLAGALGLAVVFAVTRGVGTYTLVGLAVCVTLVYWVGVQPRDDRTWSGDQVRMPDVTWEGDQFTVHDLRRFRYRSTDDWDARWTTDTFDLRQLVGADMGVEQFSSLEAVAHTFVSFRFSDGRVLVASVEIRKEAGEDFSPVRGLFRQYEKMIVLGDEEDLIALRVLHRHDEVMLHPLDIGQERVVAFLRSVLAETHALHEQPAFYNTILASCSSSLATHIRAVEPIRWDARMVLPGYADALAHDLGWLGPESLETYRTVNRLDPEHVAAAVESSSFSKVLRRER